MSNYLKSFGITGIREENIKEGIQMTCHSCKGTGKFLRKKCLICRGSGEVTLYQERRRYFHS